jgi:hypothetical protein
MTKNDLDLMSQAYLILNNVPILMGHYCYTVVNKKRKLYLMQRIVGTIPDGITYTISINGVMMLGGGAI